MRLLASVASAAEGLVAAEAGADIIDLKDPADGALGAVSPAVLGETRARLGGSRPVSAVAGNLPMEPQTVVDAVRARIAADFVKIGLFPASPEDTRAVIAALAPLAGETRLVAVLFADKEPDLSLLSDLAAAGFAGAMLDTMTKGAGGLTRQLSHARIAGFVAGSRAHKLMVGLAGSLEAPDVPRLAPLAPDFLGFRGALTKGARADAVDPARIAEIRRLIAQEGGARRVSMGVPARHAGDRVFVRDLVVPLEIGAYTHEFGRTQEVRFSVEALVAPIGSSARAVADVYSYDLIMDAVRALAASGHTVLVEELATRLAERLLADRRVREITVRVEKLGLGPGAVGVEIRRCADGEPSMADSSP